jgi:hypothetical protein
MKYWEFRGNTVRASDLSGAVILAHSACPPGARLPAEPHAPLIIANGEYTRMAKADYRTNAGECCRMAGLSPNPLSERRG